jgi:hypothetical protein
MNAAPPNGVIMPTFGGAPSASAYKLPENKAMPARKSPAAQASARAPGM